MTSRRSLRRLASLLSICLMSATGFAGVAFAADTAAADATAPAKAPQAAPAEKAPAVFTEVPADNTLPVVVLIGDSIRMGYAPVVAEQLQGKACVVAAKQNGGDSVRVLTNLDEWAAAHEPAVVHFNCGLHDLKKSKKAGTYQVPLEDYEKNLREIVDRLQKATKAKLIFATTTPIRDALHAKRGGDFGRYEEDIERYNEVALRVMKEKGIEIDDLHAVVTDAGIDKLQRTDGTHYTPRGCKVLGTAVAERVTKDLPSP